MADTLASNDQPVVLWWGRGSVDYSRNRVVRQSMSDLGYAITDFRPRISRLGNTEAWFQGIDKPAMVWVPCFRQRDVSAAARAANRWGVPLVFDPLISAFDKQVYEREKFPPDSLQAQKLLAWERERFALADLVIADTPTHAEYFAQTLGVDEDKIAVVPVSAEAELFKPTPLQPSRGRRLQVLFYGSFISLQGPQVIVEAAKLYPEADWVMLGDGPLLAGCEAAGKGTSNLRFEPRIAYEQLPKRIAQADILLGVFSSSAKAGRVVPNKVYQALACGRPVVTRQSKAYPGNLPDQPNLETGLTWIKPGDAGALAEAVKDLLEHADQLPQMGKAARNTFEKYMSAAAVEQAVERAIKKLS